MENEDSNLLKYRGMMGHSHIGITGESGHRRVACECTSLESCKRLSDNDATLAVYCRGDRRKKNAWLKCFDSREVKV